MAAAPAARRSRATCPTPAVYAGGHSGGATGSNCTALVTDEGFLVQRKYVAGCKFTRVWF
jgi:hypothetical protein